MTGITCAIAGSAAPIIVTMSPGNQTAGGTVAQWTFTAETVSVVGGTPSSYNWYFPVSGAMSWTVLSGQGTSSATIRTSGYAPGDSDNVMLACDVVVNGQTTTKTAQLSYSRS